MFRDWRHVRTVRRYLEKGGHDLHGVYRNRVG